MKIAILDARRGAGRVVENSYTVAYRNMMVLKEYFNADLFVNASDISDDDDYDIIICGFSSTSCEIDKSTEFLIRNKNARVFWLVGEYEQSTFVPLFYSKRNFEIIKNFHHKVKPKGCTGQHFLNINTLLAAPSNPVKPKKYGAIYYGRWRPDRLKYFQQYLDSNTYLSTHSKNIKMFHHNGCNPKLIKTMTWKPRMQTLNLFKVSLYLEDEFTHSNYNCLANRFYEALFCGVVPLFDESCRNTLKQSGLTDYEWHVVSNPQQVQQKIAEIDDVVLARVKRWNDEALIEKQQVLQAMMELFKNGTD